MPTIKKIIETTERTVENLITKEGEFQFLNGGFVREGVPYHIHYTSDAGEYYVAVSSDKQTVVSSIVQLNVQALDNLPNSTRQRTSSTN